MHTTSIFHIDNHQQHLLQRRKTTNNSAKTIHMAVRDTDNIHSIQNDTKISNKIKWHALNVYEKCRKHELMRRAPSIDRLMAMAFKRAACCFRSSWFLSWTMNCLTRMSISVEIIAWQCDFIGLIVFITALQLDLVVRSNYFSRNVTESMVFLFWQCFFVYKTTKPLSNVSLSNEMWTWTWTNQ